MRRAEQRRPVLSVIVPVRNGAQFLPRSLEALQTSEVPRDSWELIVVDDGSHDDSASVAEAYADLVVKIASPSRGPPAARNQGTAQARSSILVFVDADVCVHPDALRRLRERFDRELDVSAMFGAYDFSPTAAGLVSQYRNLLHAYVHARDAGDAVTFWTGLGAVRRDAFEEVGRFDETERLDDVELGYRLSARGHRIVLDPTIRGTHLKRWTLRSLVTTDVRDRGVPWTRLLLERRTARRATLNVTAKERWLTALMAAGSLAAAVWLATGQLLWLAASVGAVATTIIGDRDFVGWLARQRGWRFALQAVPLRLLYYTLNAVSVGFALLSFSWSGRRSRSGIGPLAQRAHDGGATLT